MANMLMAKDGEIENHGGTRGIDLLLFWCCVRMRLLAMLAQPDGCSPVGNESTRSNEVTPSARDSWKLFGVGGLSLEKLVFVFTPWS